MENKKAAILVLAIVAAVAIAAGGAYAMGRPVTNTGYTYPNSGYRSGMGPSMMGGYGGYSGMMGNGYGMYSMHEYMHEYMGHYWNSTSVP